MAHGDKFNKGKHRKAGLIGKFLTRDVPKSGRSLAVYLGSLVVVIAAILALAYFVGLH